MVCHVTPLLLPPPVVPFQQYLLEQKGKPTSSLVPHPPPPPLPEGVRAVPVLKRTVSRPSLATVGHGPNVSAAPPQL